MFEATFPTADIFKDLVHVARGIIENANLEVSPEGLSFSAMDSGHACLVAAEISGSSFEDGYYRCDRPMVFGIKFESLDKILRAISSEHCLKLLGDEDDEDKLYLFGHDQEHHCAVTLTLNLLQIDAERLNPDPLDPSILDASVLMPSADFWSVMHKMQLSLGFEQIAIGVSRVAGLTFDGLSPGDGNVGTARKVIKADGSPSQGLASKKKATTRAFKEKKTKKVTESWLNGKKQSKKASARVPQKSGEVEEHKEHELGAEEVAEVEQLLAAPIVRLGEKNPKLLPPSKSKRKATLPGKSKAKKKKGNASSDHGSDADADDNKDPLETGVELQHHHDVQCIFSAKYLSKIATGKTLAPWVTIHLRKDHPLTAEFTFAIGKLTFYVAPRVDDED